MFHEPLSRHPFIMGPTAMSPGTSGTLAREPTSKNTRSPRSSREPPALSETVHCFRLREAGFAHDQLDAAGLEVGKVHRNQTVNHAWCVCDVRRPPYRRSASHVRRRGP